jgi:hypothetical protein
MAFQPTKLTDRLKNRDAALKRQADALRQRLGNSKRLPASESVVVSPATPVITVPAAPAPKVAAVRMTGEPILMLTADGGTERQYLVRALQECVDLYLQAAQTGSRHCVLLWPGNLDSLPLIHALATLERWAQGYKRGIRAVLYPATQASFHRLNHIHVNRHDIATMNSMWQEVTVPFQMQPHERCIDKDMMLFALSSHYKDKHIHPCLNELLPHFMLEGECKAKDISKLNYGPTYLSHVITKLARLKHKKLVREGACMTLGPAPTAPDATFALSYKMTKAHITEALKALKASGGIDVVLLDATRVAFDRVEKVQNRIASVLNGLTEVYGESGPGVLIVTNDPRQMTNVRAAIRREETQRQRRFHVQATTGLRLTHHGSGLCGKGGEPAADLAPATISAEITDKETAKLVNQAYKLAQLKHLPKPVVEAITNASHFVRMMGNLPSAGKFLYEALDDSMADDATRRRFDWVNTCNVLKHALNAVGPDVRQPFLNWMRDATRLLDLQQQGTPLARTMATLAKRYAAAGEKVLVVVQSAFYQRLAHAYFFSEVADTEDLGERVQFASLAQREQKCKLYAPNRVIACLMAPKLLNYVVSEPKLPYAIDFLLTQSAAQATYYALAPVLTFPAFERYNARVEAILGRITSAQATPGALLPEFDYQTPAFTFTVAGAAGAPGSDRGPTDYVEIEIEGGERIQRGLQSRVYVYDPAANDSRALGFRGVPSTEVKPGQSIFLMSEAMREEAEAAFDAAGVILDHAGMFEKLLRKYHEQVREAVAERFPGTTANAARAIREAMAQRGCAQEAGNVRYWINLQHAERTPFQDLMPQAPRHFGTFRVFMEVLGFDDTQTRVFWDGAVKRVRGSRIADGISVGDHYARVIFDPEAAATYDRLSPEALQSLRAGALDNIFEVTAISVRTTPSRGS